MYCDSDRGLADEAKQAPCPCQATYRVDQAASSVKFFTGQKLPLVCKMFDSEEQAICHSHKVILFNGKRRFCRGFSYVIACCTVAQCEPLAKPHVVVDQKSTVALYTSRSLEKSNVMCHINWRVAKFEVLATIWLKT